jgi:hypothetical protein
VKIKQKKKEEKEKNEESSKLPSSLSSMYMYDAIDFDRKE